MAINTELGIVSLGSSSGKANVGASGSLASTAVTADQVVVTYTVTAGKTFHITGFDLTARLTTFAATATDSLETPAGTKLYTHVFAEPISVPGGTVVRIVCTPSEVTPFTWRGNILGYER